MFSDKAVHHPRTRHTITDINNIQYHCPINNHRHHMTFMKGLLGPMGPMGLMGLNFRDVVLKSYVHMTLWQWETIRFTSGKFKSGNIKLIAILRANYENGLNCA